MTTLKTQDITMAFKIQNRRMIAKLFLEENWSGSNKNPSEAKADQDQIKEFSKLPGVLSAYADISGLSCASRLRKLGRKLDCQDPNVRKAAAQSLALIISDSEVYGNKAVVQATGILLKGKTDEAIEMLGRFSIKADEVASVIDRIRAFIFPAISKAKHSLTDMLLERGLIPMPKKAENASEPALGW
jgi:hypothetical protein